MRRLIVMRHAKSSWNSGASTDHERPLNDRGRKDAPRIAGALLERDWIPDKVVSSDSARTQETWSRMADAFDDIPTEFTTRLYHASMGAFREVVSRQPDVHQTLLVLGHNPGWEEVVHWLCGTGVRMTTANAALLEHTGPGWDAALSRRHAWSLVEVLRPKEL